jgi:hypothetical protein
MRAFPYAERLPKDILLIKSKRTYAASRCLPEALAPHHLLRRFAGDISTAALISGYLLKHAINLPDKASSDRTAKGIY